MGFRKKAFLFFKILLSSLLIVWIIKKVDYHEFINILSKANIPFLLIGVSWLVLDRFFMSYRWNILLVAKNIKIPFSQIVKIYFLGSFSGNFLPSSVAPDAVRTYYASRYHSGISDIVSSVLVDRILGVFSMTVIAIFSLFFIFLGGGEINIKSFMAMLSILILIVILIYSEKIIKITSIDKIMKYLSLSKDNILIKNLENVYHSCNEYKNNYSVIMKALIVSFFIQILSILVIYVISLSVHVDISIIPLFLFVPLINILIMLPVSIGGIGLQEGAFIYFFSQMGVTAQEALTVALLFRGITILVSLPGGILYIMEDINKKVFSSK